MTNIPLEPLANLVLWEYSRVFDNLKTSWKQLPRDRKDHPLATVQNSSHSPVANQGGVTTQGKPWGSRVLTLGKPGGSSQFENERKCVEG